MGLDLSKRNKLIHFSTAGADSEDLWGPRSKVLFILLIILPFFSNAQSSYQKAEEYFRQENFSEAKPIFESYIDQNPSDKKAREYLGDIAAHEKDWDKAILLYKNLAEEETANANYHYKYGAAMGMKATSINRFFAFSYISDIKRELELAAKLDPSHIETRWALIEFYIQLPGIFGGSEKKAQDYAEELNKISKVDGLLAKGHVAEYFQRFQDAEDYYKMAIEVGGSAHTYEKLIQLYEKNKQTYEALEYTSLALDKLHLNRFNYLFGKIAAESNMQNQQGIDCLNQFLKNFSPKDGISKSEVFYRLAQINRNLTKKEIALTWIKKSLRNKPDFKEAQREKALILAL